MRGDRTDAEHSQSRPDAIANAAKPAGRWRVRAMAKPARHRETANLIASFELIAVLLLFWAIAANIGP